MYSPPASMMNAKHQSSANLESEKMLNLLSVTVYLFQIFVCSVHGYFMLFKALLIKQIMELVRAQIAGAGDEHEHENEDERILVLSQSTTFGECSSDKLIAYKTQLLVLLCSPLEDNRFRLDLDAFKIQFNCEKDPASMQDENYAQMTNLPSVPSLFDEMVMTKGSLEIKREKISSDILESISSSTMPLSSVFQQMGHKKFSYDEWKARIQQNIADWKFLDPNDPNSLNDTHLVDHIMCVEKTPVQIDLERLYIELDELDEKVETLEGSLQNLEQSARRNWLVLHGVFEKDKENTLDVMINIVRDKTGLQINPQDVENCHRMGRRRFRNKADPVKMQQNKRPIVIKFVNYCKRKALWDHKKHLRGSGLLLTESLTNTRLELLQTARELFGEKSVWSQDGRIMYRKPDGSKQRINNLDDLRSISNEY